MASTRIIITHTDPINGVTTGARKESIRAIINALEGFASGAKRATSLEVTANTALISAEGTVTCADVAGADTVTINGTALTATQKHATGTITCAAVDSDDAVTVQAVAFTAKQQHATGTITFATAADGDDITVGATTFTAEEGSVTPGQATYSVDTGNNEAATSFLAQVAAHAVASTVVTGTRADAVVTLRAIASGVAGNSIVLTSVDGATTAVSGAGTLTGGVAVAAGQFDMSGTNAQTATSLGAALAANATVAALMTNTVASNVVTLRSILTGTAGNAYTLTTSDGTDLAVSGAGTLTSGAAASNNAFDYTGTDAQTATNLAVAINASTTDAINDYVTASADDDEVTITAIEEGIGGNTIDIASSNGDRLATSGAQLTGGDGDDTSVTFTF